MRVGIWFDGNNFYSGWRLTAAGARVDFERLAGWLTDQVGGSQLTGAWYYTGVDDEPGSAESQESQQRLAGFLTMLEHVPGFYVTAIPGVTSLTVPISGGSTPDIRLTSVPVHFRPGWVISRDGPHRSETSAPRGRAPPRGSSCDGPARHR